MSDPSIKFEKDEVIIRLPINKSLPDSKSGKTKTIATTNGFKWPGVEYKGMSVGFSVNVNGKED